MSDRAKRTVRPWKRTEADRGYRGRVERAIARGEFTAPGTKPNAAALAAHEKLPDVSVPGSGFSKGPFLRVGPDPDKVRGKVAARREHP